MKLYIIIRHYDQYDGFEGNTSETILGVFDKETSEAKLKELQKCVIVDEVDDATGMCYNISFEVIEATLNELTKPSA